MVGETNLLTNDWDLDGLPDWWEINHFGDLAQSSADDYDGDGVPILTEWQNGVDPNKVRFSVLFDKLRTGGNTATATVAVLGGMPVQAALLVDSTDFASAAWTNYSSVMSADLGPTDGLHTVWIGLKEGVTKAKV